MTTGVQWQNTDIKKIENIVSKFLSGSSLTTSLIKIVINFLDKFNNPYLFSDADYFFIIKIIFNRIFIFFCMY